MKVNFNVLNQKASPAIYSDALANRPAPGFAGRLFVDTDNPSTGIYRDTGAAWVSLSGGGGGGGITGTGTANTLPIFTGTTAIGNSAISYTAPAIGVPQSFSFGTNTILSSTFTSAATQPIGFYIYEAPAVGFNFQRVAGSPSYNSIYSGSSDIQFKLFDGGADYYHRFFKNGRVSINTQIDSGYQFDVLGKSRINSNASNTPALRLETTDITGYTQSVLELSLTSSSTLFANLITAYNPNIGNTGRSYFNLGTAQSNYNMINVGFYKAAANSATNYGFLGSWGGTQALQWYWNGFVSIPSSNLAIGTTTDNGDRFYCGGNSTFVGTLKVGAHNTYTLGQNNTAWQTLYAQGWFGSSSGTSIQIRPGSSNDGMLMYKASAGQGCFYIWDNATTVTTYDSCILRLQSTTRGFLLPYLTTAQRTAIASPVNGLMVYDTDLSHVCFYDTSGTPGWRKISYSNA